MKQWRIPLLVVAMLLAASLRFWQLDQMPPGLYHDEAYNGLDALSLLQGKTFPQFYEGWELYAQDAHAGNPPEPARFPLFFEGNYGREPVHVYLMALTIWLFGPTPLAIRAVPAAAGVLAVWTTYLAAQAIFRNQKLEWVPILAAFTLAVLFPAVHFSRFGLRAMVFVPVETLAVYFFWRGMGTGAEGRGGVREKIWLAAAGFMLGLGLYIYAAARLFPLLFVGFVAIWFWRERGAMRLFWRSVALMAGVSLVTAVPLLIFFFQYPYFFIFRIAYVANKGKGAVEGKAWLTWMLNIGRTVRGLFWLGETHLRHNLPGRPFLDPLQAILFGLGMINVSLKKLNLRTIFLLLWLVIMLLPTIMSGDAPHFGRMTGAAPVIAIFIALGAAAIGNRMTNDILRMTFYVLLIALSAFFTTRDYFIRYAAHPQLAADFYLPDWNLGQYAAAQPPEASLFLTPTQEEMATIYFALAGDTTRLRSYTPSSLVPVGPEQTPTVYLIRPSTSHHLEQIQSLFPSVTIGDEHDNFIPASIGVTASPPQPEHALAHSWEGKIGLLGWSSEEQGDKLVVDLYWQAETAVTRNYTAFVHVLNEQGELVTQLDRPPAGYPTSDWRPGEVIIDRFAIPLPTGAYRLQTGFYYLPTLEPLGTAVILGTIHH